MSDLTSELQQMADDAARQARPLAAADVIRRGDRGIGGPSRGYLLTPSAGPARSRL